MNSTDSDRAGPRGVRAGPAAGQPRRDYGPVQLADWLRQFYDHAPVCRARELGLLPEPDRAGGSRWSAALAEQIRARWPEIEAAARCIGAPRLKERGWTEAMIRDLLGKPDLKVDNPYYKTAAPMRLWRLQRVEEAESAPGFAARRQRGARQCAAAARAPRSGRSGEPSVATAARRQPGDCR